MTFKGFYSIVLEILIVLKLTLALQSWIVNDTGDIQMGYNQSIETLQITRLPYNKLQEASCYEYTHFSTDTKEVLSTRQFCYPSIMITGHFKCSTSAMFALISKAVNVNTTAMKEECLYGNMLEHFKRLPGPDYGNGHLLSGCLSLRENSWAAKILRRPRTYYIVSLLFLS